MSRRLRHLLLRVFPPRVRRRYAEELLDLQDELSARGELSRARMVCDLLLGAILARSTRRRHVLVGAAGVVAVTIAAVILTSAAGDHAPGRAIPSRLVTALAQVPHDSALPNGSACFVGTGSCSVQGCTVPVQQSAQSTGAVQTTSPAPPVQTTPTVRATTPPRAGGCSPGTPQPRPQTVPIAASSRTQVMGAHSQPARRGAH